MGSGASSKMAGTAGASSGSLESEILAAQLARIANANPNAEDVTTLEEAKKALVFAREVVVKLLKSRRNLEKEFNLTMETHKHDTLEVPEVVSEFKKSGVVASYVWLHHAESAKEALGPLALSLDLNREAIEKARKVGSSEGQFRARKLEKEKQKIQNSFRMAKTNLDDVREEVAEQVGRTLVSDVRKYQNALDELATNEEVEYGQLEELAASIANTGPVQVGQRAIVPFDDKMQKAVVRSVGSDGRVTVSIWQVLNFVRCRYEEGYDTSQPVIESLPRHHVYAFGEKDLQTITSSTVDAVVASSGDPDRLKGVLRNPKRPEFLMALYADAAETRARLIDLGKEVERMVKVSPEDPTAELFDMNRVDKQSVEAKVPSLKGIARATVKTKEKYEGCFARLTDIARMTFICENVKAVIEVVTFIRSHAQWTIIRIKDRLHRYHDASSTGGYRDMLLNVRDHTSGHIAEIQITFRSFFTIKSGGGHAVYKLARLLELNEEETTYFLGKIDKDIVEKIGAGLVRTIRSMDIEMSENARDLLYSKNGLLSPSCAAISLTLSGVKAMDSWTLAKAASPALMQHIGQFLIKLNLGGNALSGDIPDAIGDHCINIEWIYLARSPHITGTIPENWSKLRKLRQVHLFETAISGSIPEAFFTGASALREIDFSQSNVSGEIPSSIGQLTHLIDFRVYGSKVSGKIPTSMRNLNHLQRLFMGNTDLIVPEDAEGLDYSNAADCAAFLALL